MSLQGEHMRLTLLHPGGLGPDFHVTLCQQDWHGLKWIKKEIVLVHEWLLSTLQGSGRKWVDPEASLMNARLLQDQLKCGYLLKEWSADPERREKRIHLLTADCGPQSTRDTRSIFHTPSSEWTERETEVIHENASFLPPEWEMYHSIPSILQMLNICIHTNAHITHTQHNRVLRPIQKLSRVWCQWSSRMSAFLFMWTPSVMLHGSRVSWGDMLSEVPSVKAIVGSEVMLGYG